MARDTAEKIVKQLQHVEISVADLVKDAPYEALMAEGETGWSAADYFKHLLLSVKPIVKAGEMPTSVLIKSFGASGRSSRPYEAIVEIYEKRLKQGMTAEQAPAVMPASLKIPAGTRDDQGYLLKEWSNTHKALYKVIEGFKPIDLDMVQLPHPAIGLLTFHEMLSFTCYHNTLHWHDINELIYSR